MICARTYFGQPMGNSTILSCVACATLAVAVSAAPSSQAVTTTTATPVLWRDPGPLGTKDLFWGAGHADRTPRPPFVFVKEDRSGTKPKVQVTDLNGVFWTAKFPSQSRTGSEVHAEIAASRLVWAFGYFVEEHYFVGNETITGVTGMRRRTSYALGPDGRFSAARFERRQPDVSSEGRWDLDDNPFAGSPELSGLKMLAMLVNNWDLRLGNTAIRRIGGPSGLEARYLLSDLGTAFGRMPGGSIRPTRWNVKDYQTSSFIRGLVGDRLVFCHGLDGAPPLSVPLEHARWLSSLASQLTHAQIRRAFQASGADSGEIDGFATALITRIERLQEAINGRTGETPEECA